MLLPPVAGLLWSAGLEELRIFLLQVCTHGLSEHRFGVLRVHALWMLDFQPKFPLGLYLPLVTSVPELPHDLATAGWRQALLGMEEIAVIICSFYNSPWQYAPQHTVYMRVIRVTGKP